MRPLIQADFELNVMSFGHKTAVCVCVFVCVFVCVLVCVSSNLLHSSLNFFWSHGYIVKFTMSESNLSPKHDCWD